MAQHSGPFVLLNTHAANPGSTRQVSLSMSCSEATGGPLRYRVRHEVPLWQVGERPRMRQMVVEGDPGPAV